MILFDFKPKGEKVRIMNAQLIGFVISKMVVIEVESISLKDFEIEVWQHIKTLCFWGPQTQVAVENLEIEWINVWKVM